MLPLPHHQPVPRAPGRGGGARHQCHHRLSDERACRRPAHAAARGAGRHRNSVRDLRRQDPGAGDGRGGRQAASGVVAGRSRSPARTGAARRQRRDGVSGGGGLLPRGHAHTRPAATHPAHQRQAARTAPDPAAGHRAVHRYAARLPGLRRGARILGRGDGLLIRRLRALCGNEGGERTQLAPGGIERTRHQPSETERVRHMPSESHTTCVATSATRSRGGISSTPTGIASWRVAFTATSARNTPRCRSTKSPPRSRR